MIRDIRRPTHNSLMNSAWLILFDNIASEMERSGAPKSEIEPFWDVYTELFPHSYWDAPDFVLLDLGL